MSLPAIYNVAQVQKVKSYETLPFHPHDTAFIESHSSILPDDYQEALRREYTDRYQALGKHLGERRRNANLFLLDLSEQAQKRIFTLSDDALKRKAERMSLLCRRLVRDTKNPQRALQAVLAVYQQQGFTPKLLQARHDEKGLLARLSDAIWWFRQLLRYQDKAQERFAIQLGEVRRGRGLYLSTNMFKTIQIRIQNSIKALSKLEAVNETTGETVDMLKVLKGSLANPEVRRAELMVRMRGFEEAANQAGHVGVFYTLTCPSKFHRFTTGADKSLVPNPNYGNYTPKEAQTYLTSLWARIRSQMKHHGLTMYGFRIAEPHHDGCPHWHLLLFLQPEQQTEVTELFRHYALLEDGDEKGAAEYRFKAVTIDASKGSATGYIAKYVSKNINGFAIEGDFEADAETKVSESAKRVCAWASLWGIRQFQQIGGAPVGVWRELRRLAADAVPENEVIEQARMAADASNWCDYLQSQGGVMALRKDQPLRVYTVERVSTETGEVITNRYGELVDKTEGLSLLGTPAVKTRVHTWRIQEKKDSKQPEREESLISKALALPWSPVNNCTGGNS
ncbi:MAG: replication endonuclease [Thiolinea sp.]